MFYNKYIMVVVVVPLLLLSFSQTASATSPPPSASSTERLAADVIDTMAMAAAAAEKAKTMDNTVPNGAFADGAAASATAATGAAQAAAAAGPQIPLVRLPSNTLLKYTAYKDVSILHFRIPSDTRTALFSFKAYEESKSAFRKYIYIFNFVSKINGFGWGVQF